MSVSHPRLHLGIIVRSSVNSVALRMLCFGTIKSCFLYGELPLDIVTAQFSRDSKPGKNANGETASPDKAEEKKDPKLCDDAN